MVAQLAHNQRCAGSNPAAATIVLEFYRLEQQLLFFEYMKNGMSLEKRLICHFYKI